MSGRLIQIYITHVSQQHGFWLNLQLLACTFWFAELQFDSLFSQRRFATSSCKNSHIFKRQQNVSLAFRLSLKDKNILVSGLYFLYRRTAEPQWVCHSLAALRSRADSSAGISNIPTSWKQPHEAYVEAPCALTVPEEITPCNSSPFLEIWIQPWSPPLLFSSHESPETDTNKGERSIVFIQVETELPLSLFCPHRAQSHLFLGTFGYILLQHPLPFCSTSCNKPSIKSPQIIHQVEYDGAHYSGVCCDE